MNVFHTFSSVSIVDFEQVNVTWVYSLPTISTHVKVPLLKQTKQICKACSKPAKTAEMIWRKLSELVFQ